MDQPHRDVIAAQIAVREATQALLAAEKRYHAAIARPPQRLIYNSPKQDAATITDLDDLHCAAAVYGAAAACLREAYQHIRDVLKEHPNAG